MIPFLLLVIIALILIYVRYKRKIGTNSDTNQNPIEDNCVKTEKSVDKNIKSKRESKRVRLDPNSVVINFENCDQDYDKRSLSES